MSEKFGANKSAANKQKLSPRAKRLLDIFLLTEEQWQKIYDYQRGQCAICKKPLKKANCDHAHDSGLLRGLLCPRCNRALGRFGDNLELLSAAVEYLRHPPATNALGHEHYGTPGRVNTKKQRRLIRKRKKLDILARL